MRLLEGLGLIGGFRTDKKVKIKQSVRYGSRFP